MSHGQQDGQEVRHRYQARQRVSANIWQSRAHVFHSFTFAPVPPPCMLHQRSAPEPALSSLPLASLLGYALCFNVTSTVLFPSHDLGSSP